MSKKVLIIEDDIFLGDVLVRMLKGDGFEVILARDGAEGFKRIKEIRPNLILLDIILPSMTGYEILEKQKQDPEISGIPVIIISNSGQPVEINRALALGVKDYLVKAKFDPEEVLVKVRMQFREGVENLSPIQPAVKTVPAGPASDVNLSSCKIMWVEDDKFLSDIIARKLSREGCALVHTDEGEAALRAAETEKPDLVLLDILLSGMDGFEILRRLKGNEATKDIPVIMLSNLGQKSDIDKGKGLGACRFLVKATVTLDEIVEEIKIVLKETGKCAPK